MHKNTSLLYKKPTIGLWASRSFFYFNSLEDDWASIWSKNIKIYKGLASGE